MQVFISTSLCLLTFYLWLRSAEKFSIVFCIVVNRFPYLMPVSRMFIGMQCMSFERLELLSYIRIQQPHLKMFVAYAFKSNT